VVGMIEGARHVRGRRPALWGLFVVASNRFFYGMTLVAAILLARNYFHDPNDVDAGLDTLALLLGVSGVGFLVAAVLTPLVTRWVRKEIWASLLLILAAAIVLMPGAFFTVPTLAVVAAVLGLATQGVKIVMDTVVHENVDDAYRGRVFSFYDMAFNASFVAAAAVAALSLPPDGHSYLALAVIATGFVAVGVIYYLGAVRSVQRLSRP
jgi:MFS family permease